MHIRQGKKLIFLGIFQSCTTDTHTLMESALNLCVGEDRKHPDLSKAERKWVTKMQ